MAAHDSLAPFITFDPREVPTEKVIASKGQPAKVEAVSSDPRLEVQIIARSIVTMVAYIADEGPFEASMALKIDGNFCTVTFNKGMIGEEMVEAFAAALPAGYRAELRDGSVTEVLIISVTKTPSARPEVTFLATDVGQMFRWAGNDKLRIEGCARGGRPRTHVELCIDGYRLKLPLGAGDTPLATASRLRNALPEKFTALIELPMEERGDVTLTLLKRR